MAAENKKACVIGWPVAHSLSPRLHNYWLSLYRINGSYDAREIRPEALNQALSQLEAEGYSGCNLTLPHKELVMGLLDEADATARQIGAANTLIFKNKKRIGLNTDAYGFAQSLREQTGAIKASKAVVLGAGGAARAVCAALKQEGVQQIIICNRSSEKAQALAAHFGAGFLATPWEQRETALSGCDLLVNATSLGMQQKEPLALDLAGLPLSAVVCDIVYRPLNTPLLLAARKRGNRVADGLGMLIWQAVPAFEAWFGVRPEVNPTVREYLLAA